MEGKLKIALLTIAVAALVIGASSGYMLASDSHSNSNLSPLSIIAAGSLKYAIGDGFVPQFKNSTGINTGAYFIGSVAGAREIQSGNYADVFISASAPVIPEMLIPNLTNWMIIFATNEMSIDWTSQKYSISPGAMWFENITAKGIKIATSNASLDPSGYQAIVVTKLAGILYTQWNNSFVREAFHNNYTEFMKYNNAWNNWFGPYGTLYKENYGGNYSVNDSLALYDQIFVYMMGIGQAKLTTEEIGLNSYLQSGAADYVITYTSQAKDQNLSYFKNITGGNGLNSWLNLGSINKDQIEFYSLTNSSGPSVDNIGNYPGAPILYGITILSQTKNPIEATEFVYYLISGVGQRYLDLSGFSPIAKPFGVGINNMPSSLQYSVEKVPSYMNKSAYE